MDNIEVEKAKEPAKAVKVAAAEKRRLPKTGDPESGKVIIEKRAEDSCLSSFSLYYGNGYDELFGRL